METCPKCENELKRIYTKDGYYDECPHCGYIHNELKTLLEEQEIEPDYSTPIDRLTPAQRRHYMMSVHMSLKMMTYLEIVLVIFTLISMFVANSYLMITLTAIVVVIAIYLFVGYMRIRKRLSLDVHEQEDVIIDMLNQEYQYKMLREKKNKIAASFGYLKYKRREKKEGKPFRFKTDPLFHDRVMTRVRRQTDTNRRITIQNLKNEIAAHYMKRENLLEELTAKQFKSYGDQVYVSMKLGQVSINNQIYTFDEILKATMTNHVYDDEEEVVVKEGYFKAPENYDVLPNSNEELSKHDKITYDEESGVYQHYAFVEPETKKVKVKRCDSMNIIVETTKGKVIIPIIDEVMDVNSKEYVAKQNECYNVTGGLRRAVRGTMPKEIPDLTQDENVIAQTKALEETQQQLITLLKTPVTYQVPEEYRDK